MCVHDEALYNPRLPLPYLDQCGFSFVQVEFSGLTGTVKFDKFGLRRDYRIDVLEVSLNRGLAKVQDCRTLPQFTEKDYSV